MKELKQVLEVPEMPKKRLGDTYYSVTEISEMLGVHRNTVIYWINQGNVNAVRLGMAKKSPLMISESEMERLKDESVTPV